jgi:hypothetical protein
MGWKDKLLSTYEEELEDLYKFDPPDGWKILVSSLLQYISWHNKVHDTQVKIYSIEKRNGGLHFVVHHYPQATTSSISGEIFGAIHLAESLSCKLCEVCGAPANFVKRRKEENLILGTYCNEHFPQESNQSR